MDESLIPDALGLLCWYMRYYMQRLFGSTYVCLLTSFVFALEIINNVTLFMAGRFALWMYQFSLKDSRHVTIQLRHRSLNGKNITWPKEASRMRCDTVANESRCPELFDDTCMIDNNLKYARTVFFSF